MNLVVEIYQILKSFPKEEIYGLTAQMKRAAISIPSNIAEGKLRGTRKDYRHFLVTAFGSGAELETQLEIARQLHFVTTSSLLKSTSLLNEVMKMLNVLISKLDQNL